MGLDILCVALMATLLVFGLLSGFLAQIVRLVALVGAFLLAHAASTHTKTLLMRWMDVGGLAGDLLSLFLAWVACYLAIILVGTIVARILRQSSRSIQFMDRILGGGLGAAKGLLIAYLVACGLVLLREPLDKLAPNKYLDLRGSRLAAFAEQHNVFSRIGIPGMEKFKELTVALGDRKTRQELLKDPAMRELEGNPSFQRLMNDPAFQKAVAEKRLSVILNNPSFRAALNDPRIRELIASLDLEEISKAVDTP